MKQTIALVDDDDLWLEEKLESQQKIINDHSINCDFILIFLSITTSLKLLFRAQQRRISASSIEVLIEELERIF